MKKFLTAAGVVALLTGAATAQQTRYDPDVDQNLLVLRCSGEWTTDGFAMCLGYVRAVLDDLARRGVELCLPPDMKSEDEVVTAIAMYIGEQSLDLPDYATMVTTMMPAINGTLKCDDPSIK